VNKPAVSIVVPCLDEEGTITKLLQAISEQSYDLNAVEVLVVDGLSTDRTRDKIAEFQSQNPGLSIRVIDNPGRLIPAALNKGIAAAQGEFIIRLDAHSVPQRDYVERSIASLEAGKGWNVGGVWDIQPGKESWIAKSIAIAAAHPLGVGDARYRYTDQAASVETVPFGAFKRSLIGEVGGFDESLQANEDYEFNTRIRKAGGTVWLDPDIRSTYFARPTLAQLANQYARYGFWKVRMLRRFPDTIRWRQAIPPVFVASLLILIPASFAWPWAKLALQVGMVSYALLLSFVGIQKAIQYNQFLLAAGIPLAMMTMHISWGAAFLWSLIFSGEGQTNPISNGR
jgi:glycosyltransferase involved in cell wall biosynthesis